MRIAAIAATIFALSASSAVADEIEDLLQLKAQIEEVFGEERQILAVCGASTGKSYFMQELQTGWQDDKISSGSLTFMKDGAGKPDVIFMDAQGEMKTVELEGGRVIEVFARPDTNEYVWVAIYSSGTTETYTLSLGADPIKLVLWSQGRPSVQLDKRPGARVGAKMAAFVARCV